MPGLAEHGRRQRILLEQRTLRSSAGTQAFAVLVVEAGGGEGATGERRQFLTGSLDVGGQQWGRAVPEFAVPELTVPELTVPELAVPESSVAPKTRGSAPNRPEATASVSGLRRGVSSVGRRGRRLGGCCFEVV